MNTTPASRPIIVTTDFSEISEAAFAVAREEAKLRNAPIILLAVVENWGPTIPLYEYIPPAVFDTARDEAQKEAKENLKALAARWFNGCAVQTEVRVSSIHPAEAEIVTAAEKHHAALIVMSSHGRGVLKQLWLGSVAQGVIKASPCPVLVVPQHAK